MAISAIKKNILALEAQLANIQPDPTRGLFSDGMFTQSTQEIMLQDAYLGIQKPEHVKQPTINFIKACLNTPTDTTVDDLFENPVVEQAKAIINNTMKVHGKSLEEHLKDLESMHQSEGTAKIDQEQNQAIQQAYANAIAQKAQEAQFRKSNKKAVEELAVGALLSLKGAYQSVCGDHQLDELLWMEQAWRQAQGEPFNQRLLESTVFPDAEVAELSDKQMLAIPVKSGSILSGGRTLTLSVDKDGNKKILANKGRNWSPFGKTDTMSACLLAAAKERDHGAWKGPANMTYHEKHKDKNVLKHVQIANESMLPISIQTNPVKGSPKAQQNGHEALTFLQKDPEGQKALRHNQYIQDNIGLLGTNQAKGHTPKPCATTRDAEGKATHTTDIHTLIHHKVAMHGAVLASIACDLQGLILSDPKDQAQHNLLTSLKKDIESKQAEDIENYQAKCDKLPDTLPQQDVLDLDKLNAISQQHTILALAGRLTADNENPPNAAKLAETSRTLGLNGAEQQVKDVAGVLNTIRTDEDIPDNKNGPVFEAAKHTLLSGTDDVIAGQLRTAYLEGNALKDELKKPDANDDTKKQAANTSKWHNNIQEMRRSNVTPTTINAYKETLIGQKANTTTLHQPPVLTNP
jgi:hypothetical protein